MKFKHKPKEAWELWIKALRNGKYRKTTGRLKDYREEKYCALGVACRTFELAEQALDSKWKISGTLNHAVTTKNPDEKVVMKWLDCDNRCGLYSHPTTVSNLNDKDSMSFSKIADILEEEMKERFKARG